MRTTLTIDDALLRQLRRFADAEGLSLKEVVNRALEKGLRDLTTPPKARRYRATTHAMGNPVGLDLDKALRLVSELENEEVVRKLSLRK